jgi:hypothetical protein
MRALPAKAPEAQDSAFAAPASRVTEAEEFSFRVK